jgi:uncharacterized protein YbjT (DUF2867 family)
MPASLVPKRIPENVIAIFGAYGVTGHYFLQLALEAGYHVRALMLPGIVLEDMQGNDNLSLITGTLDDESKIRRVVKNACLRIVITRSKIHHPLRVIHRGLLLTLSSACVPYWRTLVYVKYFSIRYVTNKGGTEELIL